MLYPTHPTQEETSMKRTMNTAYAYLYYYV